MNHRGTEGEAGRMPTVPGEQEQEQGEVRFKIDN
jgi:hypothetical protein